MPTDRTPTSVSRRRPCAAAVVLTLLVAPLAAQADPWPRWRGAWFDDASRARDVFGEEVGLRVRWRRTIGSGYSAVSVRDGRAVTLASSGGSDHVIALDADGGEELWRHRIGPAFPGKDGATDGPVSTPTLTEDTVYALGPFGVLLALEAASGRLRWSVDLVEALGAEQPHWGFTTAPLVAGDVLVVQVGGPEGRAFAGFDCADGSLRWTAGTDRVDYQSPILFRQGERELVVGCGETKVFALAPTSGEVLWERAHGGAGDFYARILNPLVIEGDLLLKVRSNAARLVDVGDDPAHAVFEDAWITRRLNGNYMLPVYHDGFVYGFSGSLVACIDGASGERVWRSREPGNGWLILVDDHLVALTKAGSLHVARANPEGYDERARLELFERLTWTPPSFAGGRVYARDSYAEIACVDVLDAPPVDLAEAADAGPEGLVAGLERGLRQAEDPGAFVDAFLAERGPFPVLEPDGRVHFFYRGEAEAVRLDGELLEARGSVPLRRLAGTGLFHASLVVAPDARLGYRFLVDLDDARRDPLNPREGASLRGGPLSELVMPEAAPPDVTVPEAAPEARGRLESFAVETPTIRVGRLDWSGSRRVQVYLPPGYDEDGRTYPVLFVNDGLTAREHLGMVELLDGLHARGADPVVVAFVASTSAYELARSQREPYRALLVEEIVPRVTADYRVRDDAAGRGIYGFDEGAYGALFVALSHPEVFGFAGVQSIYPGSRQDEGEVLELIAGAQRLPSVHMAWGRYDYRDPVDAIDTPALSRRLEKRLRARGARVTGGEWPEGSLFARWNERLPALLEAFTRGAAQDPAAAPPRQAGR